MRKILALLCLCVSPLFAEDPSQTIAVNKVIDTENIVGTVPDVSTGQFTVALRFRPLAQGAQTLSGRGMLFSVASGYFDGFRAHYGNTDQQIAFELGDTTLRRSVGACTRTAAMLGILHDVVFTYDGKVMKLYLDGQEAARQETSVKIDTKNAPIRVGYVNYGIGSTKMDFGTLEYYTRAFTPEEVQARYANHPESERKKIELSHAFTVANNAVNLDMKVENLEILAQLDGVSETFLQSIRDSIWQQLMARKEYAKAAPLVLAKAKTILEKEIPADEKRSDQNVRMSELFEILETLDRLATIPDCKAMAEKLREKFASDTAYLAKIHELDVSMRARTAAIEKEAKARLQALCEASKNKNAVKLYLAPDGCDENDGSAQKPLASLVVAMEKALALQKEGTSVMIEVADGNYYVAKSLEVKGTALPQTDATIRVCAAPGAKPVFNGGVSLRVFTPVTDPETLKRFQPEVRGKIVVCDLKRAGIVNFGKLGARGYGCGNDQTPWADLFIDGKAQTLARWPNVGEPELKIGEVILGPKAVETPRRVTDSETFRYTFDRPNRWANLDDIFAYGMWQWEWASRTVKVKKIDREARTIQVDNHNLVDRFTYHFLNVMEELDVPGEFYVDREKGLLYLLPPCDLSKAIVEYPVFAERFLSAAFQKNWVFDGLTFKNTQLGGFLFEHCENICLRNCELAQLGASGVTFQSGKYNGFCDSEIRNVGSCGVRMFGGNRDTLEPCYYLLDNCVISDFSRIDRAYAPAAHAIGVGMVITHNLMFDSPHHAMRVEGNDQLVARNEIHSVVYDFSDQSGVDIYCDPTYRGIVIDRNFWHHIGSSFALCGQAGIRLDDSISGVVMTENVFYRSSGGAFGGIQIHGGKDNIVARNLFADCSLGVSFSPWDEERYLKFVRERFSQRVEPYQKVGIYPFMDQIYEFPNRNYIYDNDVINSERFVRGLNRNNLFMNNVVRTLTSQPSADTPQALRTWVEIACGRDLSDMGIQKSVHFPQGQGSVPHAISPYYYREGE